MPIRFPTHSMRTIVSIPGMHCPSCEKLIRSVSEDFPGIVGMSFTPDKRVTIDHAEGFDVQKWSQTLIELGPDYAVKTL